MCQLLESLHRALQSAQPLYISLATRTDPPRARTYYFPGRTTAEAWRFAAILKVLDVVYEGLVMGITATKRDIYYKHARLFKSQAVVDRIVDDLAATWHVDRSVLRVVAGVKGLAAGGLTIHLNTGGAIDCLHSSTGVLLPQRHDIRHLEVASSVAWVLVVEKESAFHVLTRGSLTTHQIIITGKGYPDLSTREFVHLLSDMSDVPIYALVDFDPYGLDILATYKLGSAGMAHASNALTTERISWLGVKSCDVMDIMGRGLVVLEDRKIANQQFLVVLSQGDRRKANKILRRDCIRQLPEWRLV